MGYKSTIDISRAEALYFIEQHLNELDNESLANVLEELNDALYEKGYQYPDCLGAHNFYIKE